MGQIAAYLLAPALIPLAALAHSVFFAQPPCAGCSVQHWGNALLAAFFTYPATAIVAAPTLRLLPVRLRSPFVGPPLAGALLALFVFSLLAYGMGGGFAKLTATATFVAALGACSGLIFALLLGKQHPIARNISQFTLRDYFPFFSLFLAVEGGAYFGLFSCGGYAIVREIFDLVFLVSVVACTFIGRAMLSSWGRRVAFFVGSLALFTVSLAFTSAFYPGPPASLAEFYKSFIFGLTYGPC